MSEYALFQMHTTLPGKRDDVQRAWRRHMLPAVAADHGHQAYFYCVGTDPGTICAFQQYSSSEAASDFLATPAYAAYLDEVSPLLCGDSEVILLNVMWSKAVLDAST